MAHTNEPCRCSGADVIGNPTSSPTGGSVTETPSQSYSVGRDPPVPRTRTIVRVTFLRLVNGVVV